MRIPDRDICPESKPSQQFLSEPGARSKLNEGGYIQLHADDYQATAGKQEEYEGLVYPCAQVAQEIVGRWLPLRMDSAEQQAVPSATGPCVGPGHVPIPDDMLRWGIQVSNYEG